MPAVAVTNASAETGRVVPPVVVAPVPVVTVVVPLVPPSTVQLQGVRYSGSSLGLISPGWQLSRHEAQYSFFSLAAGTLHGAAVPRSTRSQRLGSSHCCGSPPYSKRSCCLSNVLAWIGLGDQDRPTSTPQLESLATCNESFETARAMPCEVVVVVVVVPCVVVATVVVPVAVVAPVVDTPEPPKPEFKAARAKSPFRVTVLMATQLPQMLSSQGQQLVHLACWDQLKRQPLGKTHRLTSGWKAKLDTPDSFGRNSTHKSDERPE